MRVPNPRNGYVPTVGERVRVVGNCHPQLVGREVEVVQVYGTDWADIKYALEDDLVLISGGELGGLEPLALSQPGSRV